MEMRLLGPVEVLDADGLVELGGTRPTRLLVALAMAERRRLTLDELADRCFGEGETPQDPVPALRTAVRRVRRAVGDSVVVTRPGGYELDVSGLDVDIDRFSEFVTEGRAASDPVAGVTCFGRALDLWRGEPFGGLGDLDWVSAERTRLEELRLVALEGWHDAHIRSGTVTEILPSLEATAAAYPMRERFRRQLMQALFLADRQSDALRVFQEYREVLIEAGLEPGSETVALERRIAVSDPGLRASTEGRPLRGYRITERLGEGAFSIVYRGSQPSVGREVAIKQIRAELANRPEFIRRFETEAHLVARLEHPHIVPLYDFWREPDSAYLVMRLLRGGSLETALRDGPWSLEKALGMVVQVGGALSVAHRAGVVHRDVKPANVLLDEDGNAYLTDFGIALEAAEAADPDAALSAGSPAYASPEQLRREPVGPPADVHGLAIATYEALTARIPFPDEPNQASLLARQLHDPIPPVRETRADLPAAVDGVLARATAKDPAGRYQTIEDFIEALQTAAAVSAPTPARAGVGTMVTADARNPYKGLRAFDEADAADFAGRARLVDQLVEAVTVNRLVAVVGPSGSGKSSAVRAGLLPALRGRAVQGSGGWFITSLLPGPNPFEELETALLRVASERPSDLLSVLTDGPRGIARGVRHAAPEDDTQILLVVDQFEELFTLADPAETRRFLDALAMAVTEERSRLRVVLTLRADFYDRPLRHDAIGRLVKDATVAVLPLAPDELEHAIVDPAHAVGADFEPGLVSEIVADVNDQPGALPLLQYALTELWEQQTSGLLTRDAYHKLGGVAGALTRRAEDLYQDTTPEEQPAIRRIFGRLVTPGEGTEDTRRRAPRSELGTSGAVTNVVDSYGQARLLSFDTDPITREPTIEVAHEALIRQWPRLRTWLDEDRHNIRIQHHLHSAATEWDDSERPDSELYRGGRLETAQGWVEQHPVDLTDVESAFLEASIEQHVEEDRRKRARFDQQAHSNRRLRRLLATVAIVAVLALLASIFAFVQRSNANERAVELDFRRLVAESANQVDVDRRRGLLLALEAHALDPSAESLGAIQRVLVRSPTNWRGSLGGVSAYSGATFLDADRLVAAGPDGVDIIDIETRTVQTSLGFRQPLSEQQAVLVSGVRVESSSDGSLIAFGTPTGEWQVRETTPANTIVASGTASDSITALALSSDGESLALGAADGTIRLLHVSSTTDVDEIVFEAGAPARDLDFNDEATLLAALFNVDQPGQIWDVAVGENIVDDLAAGTTIPLPAALTWRDEDLLVAGAAGALLLDVETESVDDLAAVSTSTGRGFLELGSDGVVVLTGIEGFVEVLAPESDQFELIATATQVGQPQDIAYNPATGLVAVVGSEGISFISTRGQGTLVQHSLPVSGPAVALAADGGALMSAPMPAPLVAPTEVWQLEPEPRRIDTLADFGWPLQASDEFLLQGTEPDLRGVWSNGKVEPVTFDMPGLPLAYGLSPDGRLGAVSTSRDGRVLVFDRRTGQEVAVLDAVIIDTPPGTSPAGTFSPELEFTPDGSELIVTVRTGGTVHFYDTTTWTESRAPLPAGQGFHRIEFTSDGSLAVTIDFDRGVELRSGSTLEVLQGPEAPLVSFAKAGGQNPVILDGDRYAVISGDREGAIIWDLAEWTQVGDPIPYETVFQPAAVANDHMLLAGVVEGETLVWDINVDSWPELACLAAGRNLTATEWNVFGPDRPYDKTCPQYP